MSEKLPFSPYPPQGRTRPSPIRRPRRTFLPLMLFLIIGWVYFSSHRRAPSPDPAYSAVQEPKDIVVEDFEPSSDSEPVTPVVSPAEPDNRVVTLPDDVPVSHHGVPQVDNLEVMPSVIPEPVPEEIETESSGEEGEKVAIDAHIMSKCPDAQDCLRKLVVPVMEQVSDLVHFNLSFVQTIEPDGSVKCKHGPEECLGDTLILCAQNIYLNSTVRSLGFANCLISNYELIPKRAHVENCALEHGVDFEALNECASESGKGESLLQDSVKWTREEGVKYSCTVRVNRKTWCIRDGGQWKECEGGSKVSDLVSKVKELAGQS